MADDGLSSALYQTFWKPLNHEKPRRLVFVQRYPTASVEVKRPLFGRVWPMNASDVDSITLHSQAVNCAAVLAWGPLQRLPTLTSCCNGNLLNSMKHSVSQR